MVQRLTVLVREVSLLGVRFHVQGPHLTITGREGLPQPLASLLDAFERSGWLRGYFGCDRAESSALELIAKLRVQPHLIETRALLRRAVRRLILDQRTNGRKIGLDIETAPEPEHRRLPPAVRFTKEGVIAERQSAPRIKGEPKDTTLLDPHRSRIAMVQLYAGGEHAFAIRGPALGLLLASHWFWRQHFVVHNATFELSFLQMVPYHLPPGRRAAGKPIECTMQATGLEIGAENSPLGGRSLANAAKVIGKIKVGKSFATSDWEAEQLSPGQIAYAAADAVLTYKLWRTLRPRLLQALGHGMNRWRAYELQRDAAPAVAAMQNTGLLVDRAEHAKQVAAWSRALAEARHAFLDATGKVPPTADNEVRTWLESELSPGELANWPRTKDGHLSIEHSILIRAADVPHARLIFAIRHHQTLLQNFGESWRHYINPVTGRIHGNFRIASAGPGRFAASAPNLQQLPIRRNPCFRRCVVAPPGHLLVACDWSMIELRALAWIYRDDALMADLAEHDIHARTAARVHGIPIEAVTKSQRDAAKPVNYGAVYGITAAGLRQNVYADFGVKMTSAEAQHALDQFAKAYSRAWTGRERNAEACWKQGYIVIPTSGRILRREWLYDRRLSFQRCANTPVQGAAADAMLRAVAQMHTCLTEGRLRSALIGTVHDELLVECPESEAETVRVLLEDVMIDAFAATFPGAPTKGVAEGVIGPNWAEAKA
jgi:DNA polymerase-1